MNRIEEIKGRIKEYRHFVNEEDSLIGNVGCNLMFDDIDYLISKLAIAEKALEQFTRGEFYRCTVENTWGPMVHMDKEPWKIAEEALKQLRE